MKTVTTENCPQCSADLVSEVQTFQATRDLPAGEQAMRHIWEVTCANGHKHRVVGRALAFDGNPARWELVVPELLHGSRMVEQSTDKNCWACGSEIQPGQSYVIDSRHPVVPRHLGC